VSAPIRLSFACEGCGSRIPLCIERELPGGINPDVLAYSDEYRAVLCGQCRAALAALTGIFASVFAGSR
jgi:hypothetical protein